jgi:hypothetical protein
MSIGSLAGEPPEPLSSTDLERIEKQIRASWSGVVTIEKRDLEMLLAELKWQRERLQRLGHVLEPLVESINSFE